MEIGLIQQVDIDNEMQQSYLDYAMSVIVARALPDARDGLKPVQRRILFSMYSMGLVPNSSYKKSARIVGEVLGKYHPHGDMAVYESMARLAQPFSMRYCQVDGQGNFGSVDGDPPAAMRYTEAKLTHYAMELIENLDRETVGFSGNFDATLYEPDVLPAAIPNLLVNGASGIAVGMATNIPPHQLGEVIDALVFMLHKWDKLDDINVSDLMNYIKGPDFPTGGIILEQSEQESLLTAYATGRGKLLVRGKVDIEDATRGRSRLVVTELPYLTNKASLIERIAALVREGVIEGVSDLRDESDRHGMRIMIELKQGIAPGPILKALYQRTLLQTTFGINMLALVNGEPRLLTLKQALKVYLEHRQVVIKRRAEFDLKRAKERIHILEGLRIAIQYLEEIIKLIRNSADADQAKERLMKRYKLSTLQSQAILDMPLKRLAAMERKRIEEEYKSISATIKDLDALLKSHKKIRSAVESELLQVKEKYNDRRRTQLITLKGEEKPSEKLTTTELIESKKVWVVLDGEGRILVSHEEKAPKINVRHPPKMLIQTNTVDILYLGSTDGEAGGVAVHALPSDEQFPDGIHISKFIRFAEGSEICSAFSVPTRKETEENLFTISVSAMGMIKKSVVTDLPGPGPSPFTLVKVNTGDKIKFAFISRDEEQILLVSQHGLGIRFENSQVRPMGLMAAGVSGMKLLEGNIITGAFSVKEGDEILVSGNLGSAWRLAVNDFPVQARSGQGVIACRLETNEKVVGCLCTRGNSLGVLRTNLGTSIRINVDQIEKGRRPYKGASIAELKSGQEIVTLDQFNLAMVAKKRNVGKARKKKQKRQKKSAA